MMPGKEAVKVTDHCVLRYLERAMDLNIELVREHILALCGGAAAFGATSVRVEGMRFEIERGVIVTVKLDHAGAAPGKRSREVTQQHMRGRG